MVNVVAFLGRYFPDSSNAIDVRSVELFGAVKEISIFKSDGTMVAKVGDRVENASFGLLDLAMVNFRTSLDIFYLLFSRRFCASDFSLIVSLAPLNVKISVENDNLSYFVKYGSRIFYYLKGVECFYLYMASEHYTLHKIFGGTYLVSDVMHEKSSVYNVLRDMVFTILKDVFSQLRVDCCDKRMFQLVEDYSLSFVHWFFDNEIKVSNKLLDISKDRLLTEQYCNLFRSLFAGIVKEGDLGNVILLSDGAFIPLLCNFFDNEKSVTVYEKYFYFKFGQLIGFAMLNKSLVLPKTHINKNVFVYALMVSKCKANIASLGLGNDSTSFDRLLCHMLFVDNGRLFDVPQPEDIYKQMKILLVMDCLVKGISSFLDKYIFIEGSDECNAFYAWLQGVDRIYEIYNKFELVGTNIVNDLHKNMFSSLGNTLFGED